MCSSCENFPTSNVDANEVPIYSKAVLPDQAYIPFVAVQPDASCGGQMLALYHLPFSRVAPTGSIQNNVYSVAGNGASFTIPDNQVVPVYIQQTSPNELRLAKGDVSATKAVALAVTADTDVAGSYILQGAGFYTFVNPHGYTVGYDYYLDDTTPGAVSTASSGIGQKLFSVIDSQTILIQIQ